MVTARDASEVAIPQLRPYTRSGRLPLFSRDSVLGHLSSALDLAERRPIGHARRVAYIALCLAEIVDADERTRRTTYQAALLHDVGLTAAAGELYPVLSDDQICSYHATIGLHGAAGHGSASIPEVELAMHRHVDAGAEFVESLGLDSEVAAAIRHHHERWSGDGFPDGLAEEAIPLAARLVAFADIAEQVIAEELNPLAARYRLFEHMSSLAHSALDPVIARNFVVVCQDDHFWIELTSPDLPAIVGARVPGP